GPTATGRLQKRARNAPRAVTVPRGPSAHEPWGALSAPTRNRRDRDVRGRGVGARRQAPVARETRRSRTAGLARPAYQGRDEGMKALRGRCMPGVVPAL